MNKSVLALIILIVLGIGGYIVSNTSSDDTMMQQTGTEGAAMMQDEAMEGDAMMEEGDAMMEEDHIIMKDESDAMMQDDNAMTGDSDSLSADDSMMAKAGSYEPYSPEKVALAKNGKVVLFFHASWCPTCRAVDADIKAHRSDIPADVTILDVDYDKATALKQQYGITYQHTFVQVDADGTQIKKWSGSPTLADIVSKL